jgi:topoisomerase-4 subunit A
VGETEKSKKEKRKAEIIHIAIFKKGDKRTIYNMVYRNGKSGFYYIKRFNVTSITRDKEYDMTQGEPGSKVLYFTANPNGEAEVIKVTLKPGPTVRKIIYDKDFSDLAIKGRQSMGNLLSKNEVAKIGLKSHGGSTLGGRKVWFDYDVFRLNYDDHGEYLGEFHNDDLILVVLDNGEFYTTNFDVNNHYDDHNILRIEKYDPNKVWTAALFDADQQGYPYVKRFTFEAGSKRQNFLGENSKSSLILLTEEPYPYIEVVPGGADSFRDPFKIDVESFIGVKSFKAKGKRITTLNIEKIRQLDPIRQPEPEPEPVEEETPVEVQPENLDPDANKSDEEIRDELMGQLNLFSEDGEDKN